MVLVQVHSSTGLANWRSPHLSFTRQTGLGRWLHSKQCTQVHLRLTVSRHIEISLPIRCAVIDSQIRWCGCSPDVPPAPKSSYGIATMVWSYIFSQQFVVRSGHSWQWCHTAQNDDIISTESKLGNESKSTPYHCLFPRWSTSIDTQRGRLHCFILSKNWK